MGQTPVDPTAAPFPPLRWQEVARRCAGRRLGDPLIYQAEVDSTNAFAARLVPDPATPGAVVVADHQTAGRGRLGRRWLAPPGAALTLTVVLPPLAAAWSLPMIAGLAIAEAAARFGIEAGLKWPNDALIAGRKCAGILIEGRVVRGASWALIGIGLNVRAADPSLPSATYLDAHALQPVPREDLLVALLDRLEHWRERAGTDAGAVHAAWRARLITLGRAVSVRTPAGTLDGLAEDVAPDGALLLRLADGTLRAVRAGDVGMARMGQPDWS